MDDKKIITKKVYKITLECKQINSTAHFSGMTNGLEMMDVPFNQMLQALKIHHGVYKTRKIEVELLEEK